jgi:hypothetical protein
MLAVATSKLNVFCRRMVAIPFYPFAFGAMLDLSVVVCSETSADLEERPALLGICTFTESSQYITSTSKSKQSTYRPLHGFDRL